MTLSEQLEVIQRALEDGDVPVGDALVMVIAAFRRDIARAEREDREAAERSVGG